MKPEGLAPDAQSPCYDLRLADPIEQPDWILTYEQWLTAHGLSNQSKNHYRGLLRRMYTVALLPAFRQRTGVTSNPFVGVHHRRHRVLTPQLRKRSSMCLTRSAVAK